jgi:hypothetical protein
VRASQHLSKKQLFERLLTRLPALPVQRIPGEFSSGNFPSLSCTKLAREVGMSRVGLHKALDRRGNPSFDTVLRVTQALGLKLVPIAA